MNLNVSVPVFQVDCHRRESLHFNIDFTDKKNNVQKTKQSDSLNPLQLLTVLRPGLQNSEIELQLCCFLDVRLRQSYLEQQMSNMLCIISRTSPPLDTPTQQRCSMCPIPDSTSRASRPWCITSSLNILIFLR